MSARTAPVLRLLFVAWLALTGSLAAAQASAPAAPASAAAAASEPAPAPAAPAAPAAAERVHVGIYVNSIQDVSFKDSKYVVDFYVWFRWRKDTAIEDMKPLETFEIMNGKVENKGSIVEKEVGEYRYASARVLATINEVWDLSAFPFDRHRIAVHIEDSAHDKRQVVFLPDTDNSRLGEEIEVSGWNFSGFRLDVTDQKYQSNYGDISLPTNAESTYSRASFSADMVRSSHGMAAKILLVLFVSTMVAFVGFLIKVVDLDPRFGVAIGALFAVVASQFIVAGMIPDNGGITLADELHVLALALIFGSLVVSSYTLRVHEGGDEERADRIDRRCAWIFPLLFIAASAALIWGQAG